MVPQPVTATPACADWLRPEDGGRAISAAAVLEVLRGQHEIIATLLWWLHGYQRPLEPEDFGLDLAGESVMHHRLARALLPPGRVVARDALMAAAYAEQLAAGFAASDVLNNLRTELARLRIVVAERTLDGHAWSIPLASSTGAYVLLAPAMPLPRGYAVMPRARNMLRRVAPERARVATRLLARGDTVARIRARTGLSDNVICELRRGRHWTQREGLVDGWQVGVKRA